MDWMTSSVTRRATDFSLLEKVQSALGPPSLPLNGYRVSYQGVKRLRRDADHSPGSRAEVNNEWS